MTDDDLDRLRLTRMIDVHHVWELDHSRRTGISFWHCLERHGGPNGDKCGESRDVRDDGSQPPTADTVTITVDITEFAALIREHAIKECAELARKRVDDCRCACGCHCGASVMTELATELDAMAAKEKK